MSTETPEATIAHAEDCAKWWARYYHWLMAMHILLGIAGVIVGALVAAGVAFGLSPAWIAALGVLSSVIVGLVSFVQPGRLANVFYDAYWRLKLVILKSADTETAKADLIKAMEEGYVRIATIQPEALSKAATAQGALDVSGLSGARRAALDEQLAALLADQRAEEEAERLADAGTPEPDAPQPDAPQPLAPPQPVAAPVGGPR